MLSVPVITLLTLLTLIFLSFEIQNTILFLSFSRTHFLYLWKKIGKFINSFFFFFFWRGGGRFFSLSGCSILFGCQSSQILFTEFTLRFILWWKKLFRCSKTFFDNRGVFSFVNWISSFYKHFLQIFPLHMKAKP